MSSVDARCDFNKVQRPPSARQQGFNVCPVIEKNLSALQVIIEGQRAANRVGCEVLTGDSRPREDGREAWQEHIGAVTSRSAPPGRLCWNSASRAQACFLKEVQPEPSLFSLIQSLLCPLGR